MERIPVKAPADRVAKRLQKACEPWNRSTLYKGNAFVLRTGGRRFTLTVNGERGKTRPQRVFRGRIKDAGKNGSVIEGRFGLSTPDRMLVYVPTQIMLLLAVFMTPRLETKFAAVLWFAVLLCSFVLIGFITAMDRVLCAERQVAMKEFLQQIGDKPA